MFSISFVRLFLNKQNSSAFFYGIFGIIAIAYHESFTLIEAYRTGTDLESNISSLKLIVLLFGIILDAFLYIVSATEDDKHD